MNQGPGAYHSILRSGFHDLYCWFKLLSTEDLTTVFTAFCICPCCRWCASVGWPVSLTSQSRWLLLVLSFLFQFSLPETAHWTIRRTTVPKYPSSHVYKLHTAEVISTGAFHPTSYHRFTDICLSPCGVSPLSFSHSWKLHDLLALFEGMYTILYFYNHYCNG